MRRLLEACDEWPCEVHRRYAEENLGCETNVETGLDWVFEHVDRVIIVEDDCEPDPSFFRFCEELLERYADDARVMMISGHAFFVDPKAFGDQTYAFGAFSSIWGWATWRRAWQRHRALLPEGRDGALAAADAAAASGNPLSPTRQDHGTLLTKAGQRYFAEVATGSTTAFSWDSFWQLTVVREGGLAVTPRVNMVQNTGFRTDATYTQTTRPSPAAEEVVFPLVHPREVSLDPAVERELERILVRAHGRLARLLKKIVPMGPLRRPARALWDVASRLSSRLSARG